MSLISRKNSIPIQALLGLVFLLTLQPACSIQRKATAGHPDSYQIKPWSLATSGIYQAVAVGDLNGDQHKDIIGGSSLPGTVAIWYGNGRGAWSFPTFLPIKGDVRSIALADFDTDGRPDLAFSIQGDNPGIQVWLNRGQEGWEKGKSPNDVGNFNGIRTEDINGDGNPDLIAAAAGIDGNGGIKVWLGDGRGDWPTEVGPTARDEYIDVAVADFSTKTAIWTLAAHLLGRTVQFVFGWVTARGAGPNWPPLIWAIFMRSQKETSIETGTSTCMQGHTRAVSGSF